MEQERYGINVSVNFEVIFMSKGLEIPFCVYGLEEITQELKNTKQAVENAEKALKEMVEAFKKSEEAVKKITVRMGEDE